MINTIYEEKSKIVSEIILDQTDKFIVKDIIEKVKSKIEDQIEKLFGTLADMENYIINKLNSMCEYGLVGKTDLYYFAV
ncbi:hypothetical protein [Streptococcus oralis]|jgi:hypothetical protein|uniref:Uncharacterized protein n=1 Tax=Streptococcus oralis subsp. dentisani TaxID=1458253 RepID=A0A1X1J6H4_STROR|nr:hypothetical protein [Streptococcus oralis]ORO80991.1 hypothetical protein B7705_08880 [Streptococcus oralis subsp. dentisani]